MPPYRVQLEIDVEAQNHQAAAVQAWELLHHPECLPWVVQVREEGGEQTVVIDLANVFDPDTRNLPIDQ